MAKKRKDRPPKQPPESEPEPQRPTFIPWLIAIVAIVVIGLLIARNFIQRTEPESYAPTGSLGPVTSVLSSPSLDNPEL